MVLELRQQLKLTQQLVMTPQLQQAIKLLQLSRLELLETVQKELLENPLLEEGLEVEARDTSVEAKQETESIRETLKEVGSEQAELLRNADWEDYLGTFSSTSKQAREFEVPDEMVSFEARLTSKPSLESHLSWQLHLSDFSELEVEVGEYIIGNLDEHGYLRATLEELASAKQVDQELVCRVLERIRHFDPVGVGSRSVEECLLLQLELLGKDDPVLVSLVRDHLEDLEKKRFKPLARKFRISMEELGEYLEVIRQLDPMPGRSFGSGETQYVSPDVFVYKYGDDFVIVLNDEGLPKLQLSPYYIEELKDRKGKDSEYLHDKMRSAMWLMKSLYQRQRTLYKVVESIVRFQHGFFEEGVAQLRPLILKDVADDIEMHESTVSRITTSKYVSTPYGIFELKFFFNSGLGVDGGGQVGSESVKAAIKKMVGGENPKRPLSDEKIALSLKEQLGVNIARRTVAKYRTALDIPSSSRRKQVF